MANIDLRDVAAGRGGFVLTGEMPGDRAWWVTPGGDINGDGVADIVIGAPQHFNGGLGKAYVVFGGQDFGAQEALAGIGAGLDGFQILGESPWTAYAVADAGDVNGDGLHDVIVGSTFDQAGGPNTGSAYVVFGKPDQTTVDLAEVAAGHGGFKLIGALAGGFIGYGPDLSGIGDVNGDGLDDVLVGAQTDPFAPGPGEAYVVFGKATSESVDLACIARGHGGFLIQPEDGAVGLGGNPTGLGAVNGDGIDDFAISAGSVYPELGAAAYVIYGRAGDLGPVDLTDVAEGTGGFKIVPEGGVPYFNDLRDAGDVNNDGYADLILGTQAGDGPAAAYVVFGSAHGGTVDLAAIARGDGGGFKIVGEEAADQAGISTGGLGDVNGDGLDDLVVGALQNGEGGPDAGAAYVVYGKTGFGTVDLADVAQGDGGLKIVGYDGIAAGYRVANLGDVTGDGIADLGVGASNYASEAGETFLLSGAELGGSDPLVFWNRFEDINSLGSSVVGPDAIAVGQDLAFEPSQFGN